MHKKFALSLFVAICAIFIAPSNCFADELPSIYIDLNQTNLETIVSQPKTNRYPGNTVRVYAENDEATAYTDVEIKGRGNSTWLEPKRPFQIAFNQKTSLLDLGKSKKWILLANALDASHMRNRLAFYLGSLLGMPYVNDGRFFNLYIDNVYQGLYYLTPKISINNDSLNLHNRQAVLAEMDNLWKPDEDSFKTRFGNHTIVFKDFKSNDEETRETARQSFIHNYDVFEQALYSNDWSAINAQIDVDSFAEYFILYEISTNLDGLATSLFLYQDGPNDLIHAGPIWDYDLAFVITSFDAENNPLPYRSWAQKNMHQYLTNMQASVENEIISRLMDFAMFRQRVNLLFQRNIFMHRDDINQLFEMHLAELLTVANQNNQFWEASDFTDSLAKLQTWLNLRLDYLSVFYSKPATLAPIATAQFDQTYKVYCRKMADQSYQVIDLATGKALQAMNPGSINSHVDFVTARDSDAQHWYIVEGESGYSLFAKSSGLILVLENGSLLLDYFNPQEISRFEITPSQNSGLSLRKNFLRFHQNALNIPITESCHESPSACASAWLLSDSPTPQLYSPELIKRGDRADRH